MAFGFSSKKFLKNFSPNFGKILMSGVVGSERKIKRVWDTSQQAILSGKPQKRRRAKLRRVPFSYACYSVLSLERTERNGTETKNQGRAYRSGKSAVSRIADAWSNNKIRQDALSFTGSYDGKEPTHKVLRLMEQEKGKKRCWLKNTRSRYNRSKQSCIGRLLADGGNYVKAVWQITPSIAAYRATTSWATTTALLIKRRFK